MIGQSNEDEQTEIGDNMLREGTFPDNASHLAPSKYPLAEVHTLPENIVSKMRSKVDNLMTVVETRVQDAVLTAIEK